MEFDFKYVVLFLWLVYSFYRRRLASGRTTAGSGRRTRRPGPTRAAPAAPAAPATMTRLERAELQPAEIADDLVSPGDDEPLPVAQPVAEETPDSIGDLHVPLDPVDTAPSAAVPASAAAIPAGRAPMAAPAAPTSRAARRPRRVPWGNPVEGIVWQAVLGSPRVHRPWRPRVRGPFQSLPESPDL